MELVNPFKTDAYYGQDFFCGRQDESVRIIKQAHAKVNTILLGAHRIGKTSLINYVFGKLKAEKEITCIYFDIQHTENIGEFVQCFYGAMSNEFPEKNRSDFSKSAEYSLVNLFDFLDKLEIRILIAIDEFQQINRYPEKNILTVLRQATQKLRNVNFIFSCGSEYLLNNFFDDGKESVFTNFDLLQLSGIKKTIYSDFIFSNFEKHKRSISKEAIDFILNWSRSHTYYTQVLCNRMFASNRDNIDIEDVHEECGRILQENESNYFIYRNLLSPVQWLLLKAIAKEEKVYHPTAKQFLMQHKIGTPANIQRALDALLSKEMVFAAHDDNKRYYQVYDCFLSRWLENLD